MSVFSSMYRGAALAAMHFFIEMDEEKRSDEVRKGLSKLLAGNYGNMALVYPAKVAKVMGLPSHPLLLSLISHYLGRVRRVTVTRPNGGEVEEVVWVRSSTKRERDRMVYIFTVAERRKLKGG